jgi:zinc/manganese transport system substrate-binding protein
MFQFTSSLPQRPPFPIAAFGAATLAVLVAGCGSPQAQVAAPNSDTAPATRIEMVASTDVYGGIVDSVGGDRVHVTSIIHTANQDPHSYEATAQDKLAVSKAQLLVETAAATTTSSPNSRPKAPPQPGS